MTVFSDLEEEGEEGCEECGCYCDDCEADPGICVNTQCSECGCGYDQDDSEGEDG